MKDLFIINTYTLNGVHRNDISQACVYSRELAEKTKERIDTVNKDCGVDVYTEIIPTTLYEDESEVPILNDVSRDEITPKEKAKILQERLMQCCIDYINETSDTDIHEVNFYADSLQESAKNGTWQPCTDSHITLYTYEKDENNLLVRKYLESYN